MDIAIIGAGMAGAACARRLVNAGRRVRLFDKGRGPGGRMSTRRVETPLGEARFDHGAQYVTARDPGFEAEMARWAAAGEAVRWTGAEEGAPSEPRWTGASAMNQLVKAALSGLRADFAMRVVEIEGKPGAWSLRFEHGVSHGPFAALIIATPAEQAAALLTPIAPGLSEEAASVRSAPCWTVMAVFDAPLFGRPPTIKCTDGPIGWAGLERSKPGRLELEAWTIQATPAWSRTHLEDDKESVAAALLEAFLQPDDPRPSWSAAHRWRYAMIESAAGAPCGWEPALGIGTCGDWRLGPRVELAWRSGDTLGTHLVETLP